jgi:hypothetical protein
LVNVTDVMFHSNTENNLYLERYILRLVVLIAPVVKARMRSDMPSGKEKAAEFRNRAAKCFEEAERMSLKDDKAQMVAIAENWLELARLAETEDQSRP